MKYYDLDYRHFTKGNIDHIFSVYGVPPTTLEIGVYVGGTTTWLIDNPNYDSFHHNHYCIDPFDQSDDVGEDLNQIYDVFQQRLSSCHNASKVTHLRKKSFDGLIQLHNEGISPQFIYIDGDHKSATVLQDLVLSFELIPVGGTILCDDTSWKYDKNDGAQYSPRMAIEMFISCNWDRITMIDLPHSGQTAFMKIK